MELPQAADSKPLKRWSLALTLVQSSLALALMCGVATLLAPFTQIVEVRASSPDLAPTLTVAIGATRIRPTDGMPVIYVPEGEFVMGSSKGDVALGFKACKAVQDNCQADRFAVEVP